MNLFDLNKRINDIITHYANVNNGINKNQLRHFTLTSKILTKNTKHHKLYRISNSDYLKFMKSQLHNISKLQHESKYLHSHSRALAQIIGRYLHVNSKIRIINRFLPINIQKPYVCDMDYHMKLLHRKKRESKLQYLISRYHAINTGEFGEKSIINSNSFEHDLYVKDVNLPDKYGDERHYSKEYMLKHRLSNQMDVVIINTHGVFILEVKNYRSPIFEVASSGNIITIDKYGYKHKNINVVRQREKHLIALHDFLNNHNIYSNIYSLIICANENSRISSHVYNVHVYKPATFYPSFINQQHQQLKNSQQQKIFKLLKKYSGPDTEKKFYEPIFIKGYLNQFRHLIIYEQEIYELYCLACLIKENCKSNNINLSKN